MKDTIKNIIAVKCITHVLSLCNDRGISKHFRIVSRSLIVFERLLMEAG